MQQMIFKRFERVWHWLQALIVFIMLATGFEIHGSFSLMGFEQAVDLHIILAWTLIGLWIFAMFWHLTTGEWKHYTPSTVDKIMAMLNYYSIGIFKGGDKPFHKTRAEKHNPLQRLAYLGLELLIIPALWLSGLFYLFYSAWSNLGWGLDLGMVAFVHIAAAFLMIAFIIVHLYLAFTTSEVKAMITGYGEVET
ncbi:MAG: cytochrome b/b6 domain-containing protein [Gammaproteobacteria bacterium]|nr:cytochrome b/b6 domain-containing protein [Gammaproteobacteria bacterium]